MSSINRPVSAGSSGGLPREEIIDANVSIPPITMLTELRVPAERADADVQDAAGGVHSPRGGG